MIKKNIEDEQFDAVDFRPSGLEKGDYDHCTFRNCNFAGTDLSSIIFQECEFVGCDFSMATLNNASFRDVKFKGCKQLGLRFDKCNSLLLSFSFESCVLNFSSFYRLKLKNTLFQECQLQEV